MDVTPGGNDSSSCKDFAGYKQTANSNRTPRVGGVGYAGVEVGMVCRYAFAEPPRRFMRVCRYRYSASGRLYTPHARKHGVCRYGSASVQMSLREVCRYVSSVQPLPLHTIPPQRAGSSSRSKFLAFRYNVLAKVKIACISWRPACY